MSLIIHAGPTPDVLVVAVVFGELEDTGSQSPHDCAEDEECHGEESIVYGYFLGAVVAASPVIVEDQKTKSERDTRGSQDDDLRPGLGAISPSGKTVPGRERLGSIEDGECGGDHGKDDETAAKVDTTKQKLGDSNSSFDFLWLPVRR